MCVCVCVCVCAGKGGSGQVWLGDYEGRPVAIKVLTTLHTTMWKRETDIYQTHMLSHPNILAFITNEVYEKRRCGFCFSVWVWLVWGGFNIGMLLAWVQFCVGVASGNSMGRAIS